MESIHNIIKIYNLYQENVVDVKLKDIERNQKFLSLHVFNFNRNFYNVTSPSAQVRILEFHVSTKVHLLITFYIRIIRWKSNLIRGQREKQGGRDRAS